MAWCSFIGSGGAHRARLLLGQRAEEWLHPGNHNLLRLTRITKSLTLLGVPELGRALYKGLVGDSEVTKAVTSETLGYWRGAVRGSENRCASSTSAASFAPLRPPSVYPQVSP